MESSTPARVLVVAHRTAATPGLADAVRSRAAAGPARFTLLVPADRARPAPADGPRGHRRAPRRARSSTARCRSSRPPPARPVDGLIGDPAPLTAIEDAINSQTFDEIIISTLPKRVSRWLRLDLPSKAAASASR